jgi:hypothetical protein
MSVRDSLEALPEATLREILAAAAVRDAVVVGMPGGGFAIRIAYGPQDRGLEKLLGTSRGGISSRRSTRSCARTTRRSIASSSDDL